MATLVGKTLGNFEILEEVGRGAMGVVFKARQLSMDRIVALKFLPRSMASDEKRVQRFIREAHAAGKLSHPNIVHVHDVGQLEGYYYISMEFVDGTTAHKQLKEQGPFDEAACLEIGTQIASALKEAHERGILHRDIKPDNFLLDKDGSARLADLGLARFEDKKEGQDGHLTQDGTALGTPHYMAPEQARGEKLDGRTDLYGLGSSLYTMAAGHTPFEGKTPALIMVKVINEEPASLKSIRPELSPGFVAVVEKLMQKDPEKRFQNAQEVVDAFGKVKAGEYVGRSGAATGKAGRITTGKVGRVTTGPAARVRPRGESGEGKNHSGLFVGLGIAAAALLGGLFLFSGGSGGNSAPRREAKSAEHETPKPVAPAILPSVPAKNDAAKKAFEQLAARHEQALGADPAGLAAAWEAFLKDHGQAPQAGAAKEKLAQAQKAARELDAAWKTVEAAAREAAEAGRYAEARAALQAFLEARPTHPSIETARAQLAQADERWVEALQAQLKQADGLVQSGEFESARKLLEDLGRGLPETLAERIRLAEKLKELEEREAAANAKQLERQEAERKKIDAAHPLAEARVRGPEAYFDFKGASEVFKNVADKQVASREAKVEAAMWAERCLRAGQAWDAALEALKAGKKPSVANLYPEGAIVTGYESAGLKCNPIKAPPGQLVPWKNLEPAQAVALVRAAVEAATPEQTLQAGLLAYAVAAWPDALDLLDQARNAKAELKDLADEPYARAQAALKGLREQQARQALAAAQENEKKKAVPEVVKALAPFGEGGELAGTDYAKDQAAEIQRLLAWTKAQGAAQPQAANQTADAKAMLEKNGWQNVSGEWKADPRNPENFTVKDGKLTLDTRNGAVEVTVQVAQETKLKVLTRDPGSLDAMLKALNMPWLGMFGGGNSIQDTVKERLNKTIGQAYGVVIEGGEAAVFAPNGPLPFDGGRGFGGRRGGRFGGGGPPGNGPGEDRGEGFSTVPVEIDRNALPPGPHKIMITTKDDVLEIRIDGKPYKTTTPLRKDGTVTIQVEGEAMLNKPRAAKL